MLRLRLLSALIILTASAFAEPRAVTPEESALLTDALEKTARDLGRWAYTEARTTRNEKGEVRSEIVVRYDPSKPYAEQWTPISINGKPPSAREIERHRKRGEAAAKRDAARERGEPDKRRTLGEVIEPGGATIVAAEGAVLTYEIPLRKDANDRFPPEKFEVLARVNRETRALERIDVRLKDSFRVKLIAKIKSGDATVEFSTVDPKYPPTLTAVRGDASVSVLFVSLGGQLDVKRSELKHVKPFNERFDVQIGTLKALDF
jgi:hypothetical protein